MPLTRQHIEEERPMRQRRLNEGVVMPKLSRAEYLHLLRTARSLGKKGIPFKLFGSTGLFAQELPG